MKDKIIELRNQVNLECEILFGYKFLILTGLKVGDIIDCSFQSSYGTYKQSYGTTIKTKGIIKESDSGTLYVESIDKIKQSYSTSNNMSGRNYKSWWVYEDKITKANIVEIIF